MYLITMFIYIGCYVTMMYVPNLAVTLFCFLFMPIATTPLTLEALSCNVIVVYPVRYTPCIYSI